MRTTPSVRVACAGVATSLVLIACDSQSPSSQGPVSPRVRGAQETFSEPAPSPEPSPQPSFVPSPDPSPPETGIDYLPDAPLADGPEKLAIQLTTVHRDLHRGISAWLQKGGELAGEDVRAIALKALFQQRIYRKLTQNERLARATLQRLPVDLQRTATDNFTAGNGLFSGLSPLKPPVRFKTTRPASPHLLRDLHRRAGRRFGIPWEILAAVNFVETRFGRILGPSSAGALGPMQFLSSTWARYGNGGDILDPHDSIFGAARYLAASGGRSDIRTALYHYNNSDDYVNGVRLYAGSIKRDPNTFYAYYYWQVFVRTTKGDKQLTGPGSNYAR